MKSRGVFGFLVDYAFALGRRLREPIELLMKIDRLRRSGFVADFIHEGSVKVALPAVTYLDACLPARRRVAHQGYEFLHRPNKEALLRKLVFSLYEQGHIPRSRSIIDIGAWIGDNAIVWSRMIAPGRGVVHAIDPSPANIAFGKQVAALNGCANINWVQAVCSDVSGVALAYSGDLEHASFEERGGETGIASRTLDDVIGAEGWGTIGLMHVDVEGFETKVLSGASGIISASSPVILFEQHIAQEDVSALCALLAGKGYAIYMVNEVLPNCALDCRNFIAAPGGMDLSRLLPVRNTEGRAGDVWFAVLGGALIPVSVNDLPGPADQPSVK